MFDNTEDHMKTVLGVRLLVGLILTLIIIGTGMYLLEKEGRKSDYLRCRAVLKGIYRQWELQDRPGSGDVERVLQGWKGITPFLFTNEVEVGAMRFKAIFGLPADAFGEKGILIISTNGVLLRVFDNGGAFLAR
jgi:hypothetical protein